jgi:ATP-dependent Lhr-like helicase
MVRPADCRPPVDTGAVPALDRFSEPTRAWFTGAFAEPTAAQEGAWQAISSGGHALVVAPDRLGQDAGRLPVVAGPAGRHPATGRRAGPLPGPVRLPAQGAGRRRRAQPARPAGRHRPGRGPLGLPRPEIQVGTRSGDTPPRSGGPSPSGPPTSSSPRPSRCSCCSQRAAEALRGVETVIVDEVHAVGRHQARRPPGRSPSTGSTSCSSARRSGSACRRRCRPIEEVATFLAGGRPVAVGRARLGQGVGPLGRRPVEDMSDLGQPTGELDGSRRATSRGRRSGRRSRSGCSTS